MVFYIPFTVHVDVSKVRMRYLVRFIMFIVPGVNHGARNYPFKRHSVAARRYVVYKRR
jgi:hypothetical protein